MDVKRIKWVMLKRVIYLNGSEEFVRLLYSLEACVVCLDASNKVVLISKTIIKEIVSVLKDGKKGQ